MDFLLIHCLVSQWAVIAIVALYFSFFLFYGNLDQSYFVQFNTEFHLIEESRISLVEFISFHIEIGRLVWWEHFGLIMADAYNHYCVLCFGFVLSFLWFWRSFPRCLSELILVGWMKSFSAQSSESAFCFDHLLHIKFSTDLHRYWNLILSFAGFVARLLLWRSWLGCRGRLMTS